jgi:Fe-S-cluster containining protein
MATALRGHVYDVMFVGHHRSDVSHMATQKPWPWHTSTQAHKTIPLAQDPSLPRRPSKMFLMPKKAADPWYRDGLRFECTQCGHCCTGAPGFVWTNDAEIAAIAAHLGMPEPEFRAVHTHQPLSSPVSLREKANGDCVFFERGVGCTIYAVRPTQCRTWPFWRSNLASPATWRRTEGNCPGSGEGPLIGVEEITRRMKAIEL